MHSELHHRRTGSGEPVVLIHGIGHRLEAWDPVLHLLAREHEVITVDLAGFGRSPAHPAGVPYSMETACENFASNFRAWGVDRPHLVGNSLGGAIALELGARGLAASVTAISPAGFFTGLDRLVALGSLVTLRAAAATPVPIARLALRPRRLRRLLGRILYEHGDRIEPAAFLDDALALRHGPAFLPTLRAGVRYAFRSSVDVPTTVAWGTRDKVLLYGQSARAVERLPAAHHVALPGCGHVPMVDDPEHVTRLVVETIRRRAGTGPEADLIVPLNQE